MHRIIKSDEKLATSNATHKILIDQDLVVEDIKVSCLFDALKEGIISMCGFRGLKIKPFSLFPFDLE
ncbi:hypothetical protein Phum_PHUM217270 [Pediculus humanus corporis]|uniref:Uncharacterized protein n=1 Tax=Pediculus humanus subsp. corporis TaxID=121224 RepID=E0VHZ4_PEDHC|nr:uncharacterized protein Phum_PHUM217270 [Pediculus humanus corporis]EEB13000.1 hypothetical protein Phum_PHUM217270 [Pediculus humanus corporis]